MLFLFSEGDWYKNYPKRTSVFLTARFCFIQLGMISPYVNYMYIESLRLEHQFSGDLHLLVEILNIHIYNNEIYRVPYCNKMLFLLAWLEVFLCASFVFWFISAPRYYQLYRKTFSSYLPLTKSQGIEDAYKIKNSSKIQPWNLKSKITVL